LARGGAQTIKTCQDLGGYRALKKALSQSPADLIDTVVKSGLRGRGGAGFPMGLKWRSAAEQSARPKYIVANGDEGDAGAYVDRFLMEGDPHALIEGMLISAYAIGASHGWIYLRHEYPAAKTALESALAEGRSAGLLGSKILGTKFNFDVEVFVGHGSYVCGEETSLFRSLEGNRPEVSARPPYATHRGVYGQPTVINNIETLVSVPWIIEHGGDAYHALGFSRSRGTKVVSLNSLFARPGLYEVEFGVPVRHIVEDLGGGLATGKLKGLIIGGPLAGIIPPHLLDTQFGFEELNTIGAGVGHGGVIGFDEHTSIPSLVHHIFSFGAYESCGKCTPCRLGSHRVEEIFARITAGQFPSASDRVEWSGIVTALKWTSLCGHGIGLGAFAESVLRCYGEELAECFA
jgi:NADH:ubiquinone oxidoreductase subunit F (NADH-binding)